MSEPGQTTCMGTAALGNGTSLLQWDFSLKHPSEQDSTEMQIKTPW